MYEIDCTVLSGSDPALAEAMCSLSVAGLCLVTFSNVARKLVGKICPSSKVQKIGIFLKKQKGRVGDKAFNLVMERMILCQFKERR